VTPGDPPILTGRWQLVALGTSQTETWYRYQDQGGTYTLSRSQILAEYFPWWSATMRQLGRGDQVSEDACLLDWIVVHWAWEVRDPASPG